MITTRDRFKSTIGFIDILFNILIGFAFLFIVAFLLIKPEAKKENFDRKAEFIVIMEWDDSRIEDIDLYVEDPIKGIVNFRSPRVNTMHLDKDDLGNSNDKVMINGKEKTIPINREVVSIRGIVPGEYVINAHYYSTHMHTLGNPPPMDVKIMVHKVNPYSILWEGTKKFIRKGQEETFVRFTVEKDGTVDGLNIRYLKRKMISPLTEGSL